MLFILYRRIVLPYIFIFYFSYTILSYDFHILCFSSYTVVLYFPIFSSFTSHILYFPMIFIYCVFHILYFHILYFHILYFHILSSCTLLIVLVTVYYHRIAVLCFSYHVIYYMHFIFIYLSYTFLFHIMYCSYTF